MVLLSVGRTRVRPYLEKFQSARATLGTRSWGLTMLKIHLSVPRPLSELSVRK